MVPNSIHPRLKALPSDLVAETKKREFYLNFFFFFFFFKLCTVLFLRVFIIQISPSPKKIEKNNKKKKCRISMRRCFYWYGEEIVSFSPEKKKLVHFLFLLLFLYWKTFNCVSFFFLSFWWICFVFDEFCSCLPPPFVECVKCDTAECGRSSSILYVNVLLADDEKRRRKVTRTTNTEHTTTTIINKWNIEFNGGHLACPDHFFSLFLLEFVEYNKRKDNKFIVYCYNFLEIDHLGCWLTDCVAS